MKRFIIFAAFAFLYINANAQTIAIINDKDGFVNVRKSKNSQSPIVGKIYNEDLFTFTGDDKSGWVSMYQSLETKSEAPLQGYIPTNRTFPIAKFKSLQNVNTFRDSSVVHNDSLTVIVKAAVFKSNSHRLTYNKVTENNTAAALIKIDGKIIFGTDGEVPHKAITALKIKLNNKFLSISKSAFDDLYEPDLASLKVYLGRDNTIYIEMDNSDGAGSYTVIWIIKNNKYVKRYIDQSMV